MSYPVIAAGGAAQAYAGKPPKPAPIRVLVYRGDTLVMRTEDGALEECSERALDIAGAVAETAQHALNGRNKLIPPTVGPLLRDPMLDDPEFQDWQAKIRSDQESHHQPHDGSKQPAPESDQSRR